jgi:hypothetical protein
MAMLHEKELVLNKTDTKNILDTVALVRSFGESMNANISFLLQGLTAAHPSLD